MPPDDEQERTPTVGGFLREVWLSAAGVTLRPTTQASYAVVVKAHLAPAFEMVPLAELRPPLGPMLQEVVADGHRVLVFSQFTPLPD